MKHRNTRVRHPRAISGLSLIELMVAIVLGLLVVGAAIGIFVSNRQTYRATESLGRTQENARTAFELMARDIREAAGNPCVNNLPIANVLNASTGSWWTNLNSWADTVRGFGPTEAFADAAFGTGTAARITGTEAIQILSGGDTVATISAHDTGGAQFTLNTTTHGFAAGDLLMACNSRQASVFQASAVSGATVNHAAGGTPGNCTSGLGLPVNCAGGAVFQFAAPNSVMVPLHSTRWYIANNAQGIRSLYQARLAGGGVQAQEVAEGVQNLQALYLLRNGTDYVSAATVSATANGWSNVMAVRIQLTIDGPERTEGNPVRREMIQVASLRNRNI